MEQDIESVIIAAIVQTMNDVLTERMVQLSNGRSLRDVNEMFAREFSDYVASVTRKDVTDVHRTIADQLARSGKEAGPTLLQLVVGARVYQSLGIRPTFGAFFPQLAA
jgi:flagellar motor switch protein FliM